MFTKERKKMRISKLITQRIISDNIFCLELALHLNKNNVFVKQLSLEKQAERHSDKLLHPFCIDFFKTKGFSENEIFENMVV